MHVLNRRLFLTHSGMLLSGFALSRPFPVPTVGTVPLSRSTPEAEGVSSEGILRLLRAWEDSPHELHGFVLARHNKVIADGWWAPYREGLPHSMYSMSKSFTSTAVGFAVSENLLQLTDPVVRFFPNQLPPSVSPELASMTLEHLLTMSVGHDRDTTWEMIQSADWIRRFLAFDVATPPGSKFLYNSGATYMLSAVLQTVTGQRVSQYLTPRLFEPLGIQGAYWDTCPAGIDTGGWGLHLRTADMARFGQLYLQQGKWEGFQLLPAAWVKQATGYRIPNGDPADASDWAQGYGYQFWRSRHQSYRGDGAFGQYTLVLPEQDAVLAIHSETPDMQGLLNLVWEHLLPAFQPKALPSDHQALLTLRHTLRNMAIAPLTGGDSSGKVDLRQGKTYLVDPNENQVDEVRFLQNGNTMEFHFRNHLGTFSLTAGIRAWRKGETNMPGSPPDLFPIPYERLSVSKISAIAAWQDDRTLLFRVQYIETAHHDTITCTFGEDSVTVDFLSSLARMMGRDAEKRVALTGRTSP
jgi:CubicO group peptidase (beta-lactamase class C family)